MRSDLIVAVMNAGRHWQHSFGLTDPVVWPQRLQKKHPKRCDIGTLIPKVKPD